MSERRSQLTWLLSGVAVSLGTVLFSLVLCELLVRSVAPQTPLATDMWEPDEVLGYRLVPHYEGTYGPEEIPLRTNSWGMRDRELSDKRPDSKRVYVLGDSLMFGYGVAIEDAFSRSLERWLVESTGKDIEVVNGGVPGWGTSQQQLYFEETVERVDPDLVLLGLFVGNDILDNIQFAKPKRGRVGGWRKRGIRAWFRENSQLYIWLRRQYNERTKRWETLERLGVDTHAKKPPRRLARGFALTEQAILRVAEGARERGIEFALMLIPRREQVYAELWNGVMSRQELEPSSYERREPNLRLAAFAASRGIAVIDLYEPLRAAGESDRELYFPVHLTPTGNDVAAEAVGEFLRERGIF